MRFYGDLDQEWAVFRALCPEELMKIVKKSDATPMICEAVTRMFELLGFEQLALEVSHQNSSGEDLEQGLSEKDYPNLMPFVRALLRLFIENIESTSLRDLFEKKVDYFY